MHTGPEDTTRDDHGENSTRDACPDLSMQASKLLHDLLHGRHDKVLHDTTRRTGDEIECVYIHEDESDPDEGWDVYAHVRMTIEFLEAPPWMDLPERTEVLATFVLYSAAYGDEGPDSQIDRLKVEEGEQLNRLEVGTGTSSPRTLLGVRYDATSWGPDTLDRMWHYFEKSEPVNQDPPVPVLAPIIPTPVACDIYLPF